jgi:tRNA U34 5-carboxymethylaminomethyl modifying GTPase MnmE/TrmE
MSSLSRKAIELAGKALGPVNKNYYIITIIGVQNSGKSTLMNYLFGTNFSVLHEAAGTRTTRGIWVSYDK